MNVCEITSWEVLGLRSICKDCLEECASTSSEDVPTTFSDTVF